MSDNSWSVKMDEVTKGRLLKLIGSSDFPTSKEFAENLVMLYEIDIAKKAAPSAMVDLEELQSLTKQINRIFINAGDRFVNLNKGKDKECEEMLALKDKSYEALHGEYIKLEAEHIESNETIKRLRGELQQLEKDNDKLTEVNISNTLLIEEYREKISTLKQTIGELQGYKLDLETANRKILSQEQNILTFTHRVAKAEDEKGQLKEKLGFEMEKALLVQSKSYEEKINQINTEANQKIKDLLLQNKVLLNLAKKNAKIKDKKVEKSS
jgi:chromosome segregation ATPase